MVGATALGGSAALITDLLAECYESIWMYPMDIAANFVDMDTVKTIIIMDMDTHTAVNIKDMTTVKTVVFM